MKNTGRGATTLAIVAALIGGGAGAAVATALEGDVPRGPRGKPGPPGPPAAPVISDVGVIESRLDALDRRLSSLEQRLARIDREGGAGR